MTVKSYETQPSIETTKGAGFSDWHGVARSLGERSLTQFLHNMDPGNTTKGANAHRVIAAQLNELGLPTQAYISPSVGQFIENPDSYLSKLPRGDYYFVSIRPGVHLAHSNSADQVVQFVQEYAKQVADTRGTDEELYISCNGEPVMSGHIIVKDDGQPNSIIAEFTNGNFNAFHRGFHTAEISVQRTWHLFEWQFRGPLEAIDGDWRSNTSYECNGGVWLTRPEMAQRIYSAMARIPHHDGYYLPGYYEVLLEKQHDAKTRAVFIEANSTVLQ